MLAQVLIGVIIGMFIGRFFRAPKQCPRVVIGYNCQGLGCDHRDSSYYEAKRTMALNKEESDNTSFRGPF